MKEFYPNALKLNRKLMGTTIKISIFAYCNKSILDEIDDLLYKYNLIFSMYDKNAELYNLNKNAYLNEINVSDDLFELIKIGKMHSLSQNSNLNICIAPIVNLWNIGFSNYRIPNKNEISHALEFTNPKDIILNENDKSISYNNPNLKIDLGSLAKGYIADRLIDFLISKGVNSAVVNLGGNIVTLGLAIHRPDLNFRIGLQNPSLPRGNHLIDLAINDMSIVTSGKYERNFTKDDITYHHIFDPSTGYPIETDMASLTIISKKSVDGEIWTSKLFGKSFEYIESQVMQNKDINAIIIYDDNKIKYTKCVERYILGRK